MLKALYQTLPTPCNKTTRNTDQIYMKWLILDIWQSQKNNPGKKEKKQVSTRIPRAFYLEFMHCRDGIPWD